MNVVDAVQAARDRIAPFVRRTPLERSPALSAETGADVWLKLECFQVTGSFKARGALSKLSSLSAAERQRGVVTASSGNHGAAVAYGMARLGIDGIVFVPENAAPAKIDKIRGYGADVQFHGLDSGLTELHARKVAEEKGAIYVSPYNDLAVIAGQGTLACELLEDAAETQAGAFDAVIVATGGGGLVAGVGAVFKTRSPGTRVIAASPHNSRDMVESLRCGKLVNCASTATLSDGTAGAIEPGAVSFELCQDVVDETALVSELEIAAAMRLIVAKQQILVEGSAAVPLAALMQRRAAFAGKRVALIVCGANVDAAVLQRILGTDS